MEHISTLGSWRVVNNTLERDFRGVHCTITPDHAGYGYWLSVDGLLDGECAVHLAHKLLGAALVCDADDVVRQALESQATQQEGSHD